MSTPADRRGAAVPKLLRCAVYTRKSTEYGLEQEFNSLDSQREAGEAYVKSQAHEGWRLLHERYDDGGVSGGTLERPALKRLLEEIEARRVDIVVVYKVDRLTRSLADFARLVDLFDRHGASFVSVTQAFNTTNSMGRLTLNVLLSFAQFEREVTGERIRDKVVASRRKGLRTGGPVALGYVVVDKKLVPDPVEVETVRLIFTRYLALGSLTALIAELDRGGVVTKVSPRRDGSVRGGVRFGKGGLAALLKNRCYVGEVVHKGRYYPADHEPIVDPALFDAVQVRLANGARREGRLNKVAPALLAGLLYDDRGHRMTPTSAHKRGARYRYYISCVLAQGRKSEAGSRPRVPAHELEAKVLEAVRTGRSESAVERLPAVQPGEAAGHPQMPPCGPATAGGADEEAMLITAHVASVVVRRERIEIVWRPGPDGTEAAPLVRPVAGAAEPSTRGRARARGRCSADPLRDPSQAAAEHRRRAGLARRARVGPRAGPAHHREPRGLQRAACANDAEPRPAGS